AEVSQVRSTSFLMRKSLPFASRTPRYSRRSVYATPRSHADAASRRAPHSDFLRYWFITDGLPRPGAGQYRSNSSPIIYQSSMDEGYPGRGRVSTRAPRLLHAPVRPQDAVNIVHEAVVDNPGQVDALRHQPPGDEPILVDVDLVQVRVTIGVLAGRRNLAS